MSEQTLTRSEREDMLKLVRQRERVAKTAAGARSAQLLAEFEAQLDRRYSYDEDEVWEAATAAAKEVVAKAKLAIAQRCRDLGIPPEFAPTLEVSWYSRGRNALKAERDEMRRVAKRRVEQIETAARLAIEQASVQAQERLWADGLTSEAARGFLAALPTVDSLMPSLDIGQVQQALSAPKTFGTRPGVGSIIADETALDEAEPG